MRTQEDVAIVTQLSQNWKFIQERFTVSPTSTRRLLESSMRVLLLLVDDYTHMKFHSPPIFGYLRSIGIIYKYLQMHAESYILIPDKPKINYPNPS